MNKSSFSSAKFGFNKDELKKNAVRDASVKLLGVEKFVDNYNQNSNALFSCFEIYNNTHAHTEISKRDIATFFYATYAQFHHTKQRYLGEEMTEIANVRKRTNWNGGEECSTTNCAFSCHL